MALAAPLPVFTILETIDAPSSTYYNFNDGTPTSLASGSLSASANASASASASASAGDALSLVLGPVYSSPPRTKLEVELEVEERTERAETISTNALTTSEPSVSPLTSPLASSPLELPNDVDDAALSESIGVAGPSTSRRFTYVGVRRGHKSGVYDNYPEAERQLIEYPLPVYKIFSTRLAAEAYVSGWDGASRHSLPSSSPRPLRDHLAMTFPAFVPLPTPSTIKRPSYHARLLTTLPALPSDTEWSPSSPDSPDFSPYSRASTSSSSISTTSTSRSTRRSMVKTSSPLRMEVEDDQESMVEHRDANRWKRASNLIGIGGLLSPPPSPKEELKPVVEKGRPSLPARPKTDPNVHSVGKAHPLSSTDMSAAAKSRQSLLRKSSSASSLWSDSLTPPPPEQPPMPIQAPSVLASNAPSFSRSALKKSGVVMPVAAPRLKTSSSLTNLAPGSRASRRPTLSSSSSTPLLHRKSDRLSTLAETSRQELQLNDEGLRALASLPAPKPAFTRTGRHSANSSVTSLSSLGSPGSISPASSILEEDEPAEFTDIALPAPVADTAVILGLNIDHQDNLMLCTKSDGDAEGSVDSTSTKSGLSGGKMEKKNGAGLFKRFTRVLKANARN